MFKMLNALSSIRVHSFAPRQIKTGRGRQGGGNAAATAVSVQDRFTALTRGIEVVVREATGCEEGKTRASSFVQAFVTLRNDLYVYVASFGSMFKGRFGAAASSQILDAINEDIAKTTQIYYVAAMLTGFFQKGPPSAGPFGLIAGWNCPNSV